MTTHLTESDDRLNATLRSLSLLLVGPLGAYVSYNFLFVLRYLPSNRYPVLEAIYRDGGLVVELAIVAFLIAAFVWMCVRRPLSYSFVPKRANLPAYANALIVIALAALIALSIYRVLGSFDVANFAANFALYRALATRGNAWMILACYAGIYLVLLDMYFGGVTKVNTTSFLASIMIVSLSGGRTILILFAIAFLILLLFQRILWWKFIVVAVLTTLLMLSSYFLVTNLRAPPGSTVPVEMAACPTGQSLTCSATQHPQEQPEEALLEPTDSFGDLNYNAAVCPTDQSLTCNETQRPQEQPEEAFLEPTDSFGDLNYNAAVCPTGQSLTCSETQYQLEQPEEVFLEPTDSFSDLNYNAAFITEDVVRKLRSEDLIPEPYFLSDIFYKFIPRAIAPNKPISSAETRVLYPAVAARGTNITFPLKANLMVHIGERAFYLDWVVVAVFQLLLMFSIVWRNRSPTTVGFVVLVSGATFTLISRGGILNARLIDQVMCIAAAWAAYQILQLLNRRAFGNQRTIDNKQIVG